MNSFLFLFTYLVALPTNAEMLLAGKNQQLLLVTEVASFLSLLDWNEIFHLSSSLPALCLWCWIKGKKLERLWGVGG